MDITLNRWYKITIWDNPESKFTCYSFPYDNNGKIYAKEMTLSGGNTIFNNDEVNESLFDEEMFKIIEFDIYSDSKIFLAISKLVDIADIAKYRIKNEMASG